MVRYTDEIALVVVADLDLDLNDAELCSHETMSTIVAWLESYPSILAEEAVLTSVVKENTLGSKLGIIPLLSRRLLNYKSDNPAEAPL